MGEKPIFQIFMYLCYSLPRGPSFLLLVDKFVGTNLDAKSTRGWVAWTPRIRWNEPNKRPQTLSLFTKKPILCSEDNNSPRSNSYPLLLQKNSLSSGDKTRRALYFNVVEYHAGWPFDFFVGIGFTWVSSLPMDRPSCPSYVLSPDPIPPI